MRRGRRGLAALEDLTQLQALDLSDTPVTSAGMTTVARMRGLHTLALSFGGAPQPQTICVPLSCTDRNSFCGL